MSADSCKTLKRHFKFEIRPFFYVETVQLCLFPELQVEDRDKPTLARAQRKVAGAFSERGGRARTLSTAGERMSRLLPSKSAI